MNGGLHLHSLCLEAYQHFNWPWLRCVAFTKRSVAASGATAKISTCVVTFTPAYNWPTSTSRPPLPSLRRLPASR